MATSQAVATRMKFMSTCLRVVRNAWCREQGDLRMEVEVGAVGSFVVHVVAVVDVVKINSKTKSTTQHSPSKVQSMSPHYKETAEAITINEIATPAPLKVLSVESFVKQA